MYTDATARTPRTAAIQDAEDLCRQYPNKCSSWLTLYKAKVKIDPFYKPDYEFEQMKNRCDDFNGFYREAEETADRIIGKTVSDFISAFFSKILKTVLIALGSCVSLAGAFLFAVLGTEGLKTIGYVLIGVAVLLAIFFVMKIVSLKAPRNKLVVKIFFDSDFPDERHPEWDRWEIFKDDIAENFGCDAEIYWSGEWEWRDGKPVAL